jgi:hypothetical protein
MYSLGISFGFERARTLRIKIIDEEGEACGGTFFTLRVTSEILRNGIRNVPLSEAMLHF